MKNDELGTGKIRSLAGKITLLLACFYFGEVVLGGPGSWSKVFLNVDIRKVFFGGICFALLVGIVRAKAFKLLDVVIMIGGLLMFAFWIIVLPTLNGTDMAMSSADGIPILSMFLVTILFKLYSGNTDQERFVIFNKISDFIFMMSTFAALVHLGLFLALNFWPDIGFELLIGLKLILDNQDAGSIFVGPMPDGSIRVFWISSMFLVFGLYRSIVNMRFGVDPMKLLRFMLFVAAILVTQTRSIFLAVPIAFCFAAMFYFWIRYSRVSLFSLSINLALILFLITFLQLILVSTDVMSLIGLAREGSDQERALQVGPIMVGWLNNFIFGGGFGYSVSYVRSEAAPFSYEFSIAALYMKLGIVGLVLMWAYFMYMCNSMAKPVFSLKQCAYEYAGLVFIIFIYFFIFNTNPYLSNSVGVAIFLMLCVEAARLLKKPVVSIMPAKKVGNEF